MQRPLEDHIALLEKEFQTLRAQCDDFKRPADEHLELSVELDLAERALDHFRQAYELVQELSAKTPNYIPDRSPTT